MTAEESFPACIVEVANKEQVLRAGRTLPAGPVPSITANAAQKADAADTTTKPKSTACGSSPGPCAMQELEASLRFPLGFPKPKWELCLVARWETDFDIGAK